MVLGFHSDSVHKWLCFKSVLPVSPLERDNEHWTNKKTIGCVHFPFFCVLEIFCPQAFVCMQSANFVRKDLTYCFPALFVIMYILTLSDVVYSFKFVIGCEVNVGTSLQQLKLSL